MTKHYWAVRPKSQNGANTRIEKAETAHAAYVMAFGRGGNGVGFQYKDLGPRVAVIQSDSKRIALLKDPNGWRDFIDNRKPLKMPPTVETVEDVSSREIVFRLTPEPALALLETLADLIGCRGLLDTMTEDDAEELEEAYRQLYNAARERLPRRTKGLLPPAEVKR